MSYPIVEVEWIDSATTGGWRAMDAENPVVSCLTAGYLVGDHVDRYVIAAAACCASVVAAI